MYPLALLHEVTNLTGGGFLTAAGVAGFLLLIMLSVRVPDMAPVLFYAWPSSKSSCDWTNS